MSLSILLKRRWKKIKLKEYIRKHTTILLDRVLAKVATPAALWIRLMMIVAIEPKIASAINILNASDWSILSILKWDSEKYPPLIIPATVEITLSKIVSCIVTSFSKLCFFFIAKKSQVFKHLVHLNNSFQNLSVRFIIRFISPHVLHWGESLNSGSFASTSTQPSSLE